MTDLKPLMLSSNTSFKHFLTTEVTILSVYINSDVTDKLVFFSSLMLIPYEPDQAEV
jgi:hypothetical protein